MIQSIKNIIKMAFVSLNDSDSKPYPQLQITFNGQAKNATRLEPYGHWSMPPKGSLAVCFSSLGQESTMFAISNDYLNRPKNLKEGEVIQGAFKFDAYSYYQDSGQSSVVGTKIYLGSSSISIVEQLTFIIDEILAATYPTAVGPTGTIIVPAPLLAIKADLESIMGGAPNVN